MYFLSSWIWLKSLYFEVCIAEIIVQERKEEVLITSKTTNILLSHQYDLHIWSMVICSTGWSEENVIFLVLVVVFKKLELILI